MVKTTRYFENKVLKEKRPFLKHEWCERVRQNPEYTAVEGDTGRIRHWAFVP